MNAPYRPWKDPADHQLTKSEPAWKFHVTVAAAIVGGMGTMFMLVATMFILSRLIGPDYAMLAVGAVLAGGAGVAVLMLRSKGKP